MLMVHIDNHCVYNGLATVCIYMKNSSYAHNYAELRFLTYVLFSFVQILILFSNDKTSPNREINNNVETFNDKLNVFNLN